MPVNTDKTKKSIKTNYTELLKNNKWVIAVLIGTVFVGSYLHNQSLRFDEFRETRSLLGTLVTIQCLHRPNQDVLPAVKKCWERIEEIQTAMNAKSAVGYVAKINESGYNGVEVKPELYNLIKESIKYSKLTKGAFDITVLPLIELWQNAQETNELPLPEQINIAKDKTGYEYISLKSRKSVLLEKKGMKIDLGAIAKGYAVDEAAKILKKAKITNFLIDAGGDIYCGGTRRGREWIIGIQDPLDESKLTGKIKLSDIAVTTSGNYERFYTIKDKRFSHIINPVTGYPQEKVVSATVIAATTREADALSTALSVLGARDGIRLINKLTGVEALILEKKDDKIKEYYSENYKKYTF